MRRGMVLLAALVVMLGIATPAVARGNPHQPPNDEGYHCADVGPAWDLGAYDATAGVYTATISDEPQHVGVCIDLLDTHRNTGTWTVTWNFDVPEGDLRGLMLLFNRGLTGSRYAEYEATPQGASGSGTWTTHEFTPAVEGPFAFVALRDIKGAKKSNWSINFTITPHMDE